MKPEPLAALTDEELLKRMKWLKNIHKLILATGIVALVIGFLMFGYYVGKDAATGGKGEFQYKPLIPFVLLFIVGNSVLSNQQKSVNEEIKKRKLA